MYVHMLAVTPALSEYSSHSSCPTLDMRRSNSKRNGDLTLQLFGAADQLQVSGCLVTSRCCLPSAADEEWHSSKRPNSTTAVNSLPVFTEVSKNHLFIARSQWQQAPLHSAVCVHC